MDMSKIIEEVRAELGNGFTVEEVNIDKNNGTKKHGISIRKDGECISPNIYIDDSMTATDIVDVYKGSLLNAPDFDVNELSSKEYILKNVIPVLVNSERNANRLNELVNVPYADLSILFRVMVSSSTDGLATYLVKKDLLEKLDIDKAQLLESALANIQGQGEVKSMFDTLSEIAPVPMPAPTPTDPAIYVISSKNKTYGAGMILDKVVRDKLHELLGDYFLIPSSIHEMLAAPKDLCAKDMVQIIKEVNSSVVASEEILSDNLYAIVDDKLEVVA